MKSPGSVSAFAVGIKRRSGTTETGTEGGYEVVSKIDRAKVGPERVTYGTVETDVDGPWRYVAGGAAARIGNGVKDHMGVVKAFLTMTTPASNGVSCAASAQEYVMEFKHELYVSGVRLFGAVYVVDEKSVDGIGEDAEVL